MSLLEVENCKAYYPTARGIVRAVDGVSFSIKKGEFLGLAGESGCGKSTLAYAIMNILPLPGRIVDGHIYFKGTDFVSMKEEEMRKVRWKGISMVFQQSMNAFNPVVNIEKQIVEPILKHEKVTKKEALRKARYLFEEVGLSTERIKSFPFEFSGGMKQRAMIAMALACDPDLVIADEPTTALDTTIQLQVLDLIRSLRTKFGLSMLLITHNLSVIAETCDKVAIMYAGKIVENGEITSLFRAPIHPYSKGLIEAIPTREKAKSRRLFSMPGFPPNLINPPDCCRFHERCPAAKQICGRKEPALVEIRGREVACHYSDDLKEVSATELWGGIGE